MVVAVVVLAGGAAAGAVLLMGATTSPTTAVTGFVNAIKDHDFSTAASYVDPQDRPSNIGSAFDQLVGNASLSMIEVQNFSVIAQRISGDHAWVTVTGNVCIEVAGCNDQGIDSLIGDAAGNSAAASGNTIPCEEVGGRWYVYGGRASWAETPPSSNSESSGSTNSNPGTNLGNQSQSTTSTTAVQSAEQEARTLASLLAQSASERSAVLSATAQITSCGDLQGAETALNQADTEREKALNQLAQMNISALPTSTSLTNDLQTAWESSEQSDSSYSQWAQDEINNGCTPNDFSDSNYQAAQTTDQQAEASKQAFVTLWNPVATTYGLPTYAADQI